MAKKRKLITRCRLKWIGVVLCVFLACVFVGSRWLYVGLSYDRFFGQLWGTSVIDGQFILGSTYGFDFQGPMDGIEFEHEVRAEPGMSFWFDWEQVEWGQGDGHWKIITPLWLPLLIIAAPTAWLWRTDRRAKPWQCESCRYDLRGLEPDPKTDSSESYPTKCPECGTTKNP